MVDIIKAMGFTPLPTAIIILLVSAIFFLLKKIGDNITKRVDELIKKRDNELVVINSSLEALTKEVAEMKDKLSLSIDTTTLLAYHQCMNEAMAWKEKGEIPVGAKMHFDKVWNSYLQLGDGHGSDPKEMIDSLPIVS